MKLESSERTRPLENPRKRNNGSKTRKKKRGSYSRDNREWELREERSSSGSTSRKAQKNSPFGSSSADEKSLQAWVEDLLKIALAEDRKREVRERRNVAQEDSNS